MTETELDENEASSRDEMRRETESSQNGENWARSEWRQSPVRMEPVVGQNGASRRQSTKKGSAEIYCELL
jgi:hypothetical protein